MRVAFLLVMLAAPLALADSDRERRVKVALALAGAETAPAPVAARPAEACGTCRTDLDAVRAECQRTGRPFVVFVGGCHARGREVEAMGAVPVRVPSYAHDGATPADAPRVIVAGRHWGKLVIEAALPATADAATIRGHVLAVLPRMPRVGEVSPRGVVAAVNERTGCWAVRRGGLLTWFCPVNGEAIQ